jgi:dTMP kinase
MKTGKLFVFEGADEVGKTTLATMLLGAFRSKGVACEMVGFPGNKVGTLGHHINRLHHAPELFQVESIDPTSLQLLHVAAHVDAIDHQIIPALRSDKAVVLDRFWWSSMIYGAVGHANKRSLQAAIRAEAIHWRGIKPAQVFLVTCSEPFERQISIRRWKQIDALYKKFAAREKKRYPVTVIKNDSTPKSAFAQVEKCLDGA